MSLDRKYISRPDFLVMKPLLTKVITKEHGGICPWKPSNILPLSSCFLFFFHLKLHAWNDALPREKTLNKSTAGQENSFLYEFDVHVTMQPVKFLIIKSARCTNFSNLFLEWNYMFRTVPLSIIRSFTCTHSNGICHTCLLTACEQDQDGTAVLFWSCSHAVSKHV